MSGPARVSVKQSHVPAPAPRRGRFEVSADQVMPLFDWERLPKAPAGYIDIIHEILPLMRSEEPLISQTLMADAAMGSSQLSAPQRPHSQRITMPSSTFQGITGAVKSRRRATEFVSAHAGGFLGVPGAAMEHAGSHWLAAAPPLGTEHGAHMEISSPGTHMPSRSPASSFGGSYDAGSFGVSSFNGTSGSMGEEQAYLHGAAGAMPVARASAVGGAASVRLLAGGSAGPLPPPFEGSSRTQSVGHSPQHGMLPPALPPLTAAPSAVGALSGGSDAGGGLLRPPAAGPGPEAAVPAVLAKEYTHALDALAQLQAAVAALGKGLGVGLGAPQGPVARLAPSGAGAESGSSLALAGAGLSRGPSSPGGSPLGAATIAAPFTFSDGPEAFPGPAAPGTGATLAGAGVAAGTAKPSVGVPAGGVPIAAAAPLSAAGGPAGVSGSGSERESSTAAAAAAAADGERESARPSLATLSMGGGGPATGASSAKSGESSGTAAAGAPGAGAGGAAGGRSAGSGRASGTASGAAQEAGGAGSSELERLRGELERAVEEKRRLEVANRRLEEKRKRAEEEATVHKQKWEKLDRLVTATATAAPSAAGGSVAPAPTIGLGGAVAGSSGALSAAAPVLLQQPGGPGVSAGAGAAVPGSGHVSGAAASASAAPLAAGQHTASQGSLPGSGAAQVPGLLAPGLPHVSSFLSLPGTPLSGSLPGSLSLPSLGAGPAGQQHTLASAGHVLSALPPALNGAPGQPAHVVAASAPASTGVPGSQP